MHVVMPMVMRVVVTVRGVMTVLMTMTVIVRRAGCVQGGMGRVIEMRVPVSMLSFNG
jgi:hypothetical protein